MILLVGPTGSGKSSTLFTFLNRLNVEAVNIITIEDPVEFDIAGITQAQVNDKTGTTFSSALRSALRQDPDIISIGEIRDAQTADIAAARCRHVTWRLHGARQRRHPTLTAT